MKKNILYVLLLFFCFSCQKNELQMYSGIDAIQLNSLEDTLSNYSFYFHAPSVLEDTIWVKFRTTGYTSSQDRNFLLKQIHIEGIENAVPDKHYKTLSPDLLKVKADSVYAYVPIVLLRNNLLPKTTYALKFEICENQYFKLGEKDKLSFEILFTSGLTKPNEWNDYITKFVLGDWSYNKHEWLISQTGQKWDDDFLLSRMEQPGIENFWTGKLNQLLKEYNNAGNILLDDGGVEITGFPN